MMRLVAAFFMFALLGSPDVSAQSWAAGDARNARQKGETIPLAVIIKKLESEHGGQYLKADLFSKPGGGTEYHISWEKNGRKILFVVDAKTGRVIRTNGG